MLVADREAVRSRRSPSNKRLIAVSVAIQRPYIHPSTRRRHAVPHLDDLAQHGKELAH